MDSKNTALMITQSAVDQLISPSSSSPGATITPSSSRMGSVVVISVEGALVPKDGMGLMSYEAISGAVMGAVADPTVSGIVMDFDSPGGTVAGAFDCADNIMMAARQKPVIAYVSDYATSAAYLLASQCTKIVANQTATVGSIGVISVHTDLSAMFEGAGINHSILTAGNRKADGSPLAPLGDEARTDINQLLESSRDMFIESVARGRAAAGFDQSMIAKIARASEASTMSAQDGKTMFFVDQIGTLSVALARAGGGDIPATAGAGKPASDISPVASAKMFAAHSRGERVNYKKTDVTHDSGPVASARKFAEARRNSKKF